MEESGKSRNTIVDRYGEEEFESIRGKRGFARI